MLMFCPQCGTYGLDRTIDPDRSVAVCPACEEALSFQSLPLFIVGGASGVGKTTVYRELAGKLDGVICLDVDTMWDGAFAQIKDDFEYTAYYLRQCLAIAQSGHPVVLFGAEVGQPGVVEATVERRYFSAIYYLALTCDPERQADRLRGRSNWADATDRWTEVDEQVALNQWYRKQGRESDTPIETIDTTDRSVSTVRDQLATWIEERLASSTGM